MSTKVSKKVVKAAKTELRRRALAELRERDPDLWAQTIIDQIVASMTLKQRMVLNDLDNGIRRIALCCGRRAGKTTLLGKLIVIKLLRAGHNEAVIYVAEDLKKGKRIIWKDVDKVCKHYFLDTIWRIREHIGQIDTDQGAAFFIQGLNQEKQAESARGFKAILYCIDECQSYDHLLEPTIVAVMPALADTKGAFIAAGTPGWDETSTWYAITQEGFRGFVAYNWTILDNEKFPQDVEETLREAREDNGYTEEHPDYQREWLGIWAKDVSKFLCEFIAGRNTLHAVPPEYGSHWRHVMGMDYGWDDAVTWVVVAVNPFGPERFVVWSEGAHNIDNDAIAKKTAEIARKFGTTYVVCDPAGGGKAFFEGTFNPKYGKEMGLSIRSANKLGKVDSVKVMNTEFRTGRLRLIVDNTKPLAKELHQLKWKDKEKGEVLTSPPKVTDDHFDALRYAMVEVGAWNPREEPAPTPPPTPVQAAVLQAKRDWAQQVKTDPDARLREQRNRAERSMRSGLFGRR